MSEANRLTLAYAICDHMLRDVPRELYRKRRREVVKKITRALECLGHDPGPSHQPWLARFAAERIEGSRYDEGEIRIRLGEFLTEIAEIDWATPFHHAPKRLREGEQQRFVSRGLQHKAFQPQIAFTPSITLSSASALTLTGEQRTLTGEQ